MLNKVTMMLYDGTEEVLSCCKTSKTQDIYNT